MTQPEGLLSLRGISKRSDALPALIGVDIDIAVGEFVVIVGPAGSGKTTMLRLIAGIDTPTAGDIFMQGERVTHLLADRRGIAVVPPHQSLTPTLSIRQHIARGLGDNPEERIQHLLSLAGPEAPRDCAVEHLSPSQRVRLAVLCAAASAPKALLMESPTDISGAQALDDMCHGLKGMQRRLGIAFIYFTRSPQEAMRMADRIALLSAGRVVQVGTPENLYQHPVSPFCAQYMGECNLLPCTVSAVQGEGVLLDLGGTQVPAFTEHWIVPGEPLCLCVRPERIRLALSAPPGACAIRGKLVATRFVGPDIISTFTLSSEHTVRVRQQAAEADTSLPGQIRTLWWYPQDATLLWHAADDSPITGAAAAVPYQPTGGVF